MRNCMSIFQFCLKWWWDFPLLSPVPFLPSHSKPLCSSTLTILHIKNPSTLPQMTTKSCFPMQPMPQLDLDFTSHNTFQLWPLPLPTVYHPTLLWPLMTSPSSLFPHPPTSFPHPAHHHLHIIISLHHPLYPIFLWLSLLPWPKPLICSCSLFSFFNYQVPTNA